MSIAHIIKRYTNVLFTYTHLLTFSAAVNKTATKFDKSAVANWTIIASDVYQSRKLKSQVKSQVNKQTYKQVANPKVAIRVSTGVQVSYSSSRLWNILPIMCR